MLDWNKNSSEGALISVRKLRKSLFGVYDKRCYTSTRIDVPIQDKRMFTACTRWFSWITQDIVQRLRSTTFNRCANVCSHSCLQNIPFLLKWMFRQCRKQYSDSVQMDVPTMPQMIFRYYANGCTQCSWLSFRHFHNYYFIRYARAWHRPHPPPSTADQYKTNSDHSVTPLYVLHTLPLIYNK